MESLSKIKILKFSSSSSPKTENQNISNESEKPIYLITWTDQHNNYIYGQQYDVFYMSLKYGKGPCFSALYNDHSNTVKLAYCEIFLDPPELRGHYIGTYLFNETVKWAKQFTDVKVLPINIVDVDDNVKRRRNFYKQFGFQIVEDNDGKAHTLEMNVKDLKEKLLTEEQVTEYEVKDFINTLVSNNEQKEQTIKEIKQTIKVYENNYILKRPNIFSRIYYKYFR